MWEIWSATSEPSWLKKKKGKQSQKAGRYQEKGIISKNVRALNRLKKKVPTRSKATLSSRWDIEPPREKKPSTGNQ